MEPNQNRFCRLDGPRLELDITPFKGIEHNRIVGKAYGFAGMNIDREADRKTFIKEHLWTTLELSKESFEGQGNRKKNARTKFDPSCRKSYN